jgi:hypothetical protein
LFCGGISGKVSVIHASGENVNGGGLNKQKYKSLFI